MFMVLNTEKMFVYDENICSVHRPALSHLPEGRGGGLAEVKEQEWLGSSIIPL